MLLLEIGLVISDKTIFPGENVSIVQSNPMISLGIGHLMDLKEYVRVTLEVSRPYESGESCALMMRRGLVPDVNSDGGITADLVDLSSWELRKNKHFLSFSQSILTPGESVYLGIAYFAQYRNSSLPYQVRLETSASPLCPDDCNSAGYCSVTDICKCFDGYFGQACAVTLPLLVPGETDIVYVPVQGYSFFYFNTNQNAVSMNLKWAPGSINIAWRHSDNSSDLPTYLKAERIIWNVTEECDLKFAGDTGQYILGLYNPSYATIKASVSLAVSREMSNSNIIIVSVCSLLGGSLVLMWGVYIYCKVRRHHTNVLIVPELLTEPTNTVLLLSLFPVDTYSNLPESLNSTCSVCLDNFHPKDQVRILLCYHVYHIHCIDKWLEQQQFCCMCKRDYSRPEELVSEAKSFSLAKTTLGETTRGAQESESLQHTEGMDFTFSQVEELVLTG